MKQHWGGKEGDSKHGSDNSPSIDRLVPHKGYVKGNVRVVSNRANRFKQDCTLEEMELIFKYMKENIPCELEVHEIQDEDFFVEGETLSSDEI